MKGDFYYETDFGMGVLGLMGGLAAYCCGYKSGKNDIDPVLTELWGGLDKDGIDGLWSWFVDENNLGHDAFFIATEDDIKNIENGEMK